MDKVLGGDIIVEQNIHVIDVANWLLQGHPTKAYGSGGRTDWRGTGYDAGDAWDHFLVTVPVRQQRACRFQFEPADQFASATCACACSASMAAPIRITAG